MRNKELWVFAAVLVGIAAAGCAAVFVLGGMAAGLVCSAMALCLCGGALGFTLWRYSKLRTLTDAVARAASEGLVLDLRTNREGELSILQNDLYKLTSALAGKNEKLQSDKRFLADTLSDISHQLKTPLTSLMVNTDLLQEAELPEEKRQEFYQRITGQLERLRWLVNALLRLSRVDAAVVEFKRDRIELHRLLNRSAEPLLALAEERGVALEIEAPQTLRWVGDYEWTAEAIGNLVKNCVEHSPEGGRVWLHCVDNPLQTLVLVEDEGPGFAAEDLPRLFERFYRGRRTGGEGVGIGLSMARAILRGQGAEVLAENRPEGGARFIVKLYKTGGQ